MMNRFLALVVVMGTALMVPTMSGCAGSTTQPTGSSVPKAGGGTAKPAEAPAEVNAGDGLEEIEETYHYNPIGKRDPFRSPIERSAEERISNDPLQKYDLDQYRLVAVIWGSAEDDSMGMVEDPTGAGHVVTRGTIIGKNWGTVSQIKTDEIIVTEEIQDRLDDRIITNEYSLALIRTDDKKKRR
jgi:type IV pilus assembly protein PilP